MNITSSNSLFDLEYFFELSPDLIFVAGYDGYLKKINSAVTKTLGYTKEELFARPIESFIHIEDRVVTAKKRNLIIQNTPLLNFDNRYITKSGEIVWLTWTSMPVEEEKVVFAIAKNITDKKRMEEDRRKTNILRHPIRQKAKFSEESEILKQRYKIPYIVTRANQIESECSRADQIWLARFEKLVRIHTGKVELTINMLSSEMAMSERQLFRRIKTIMDVTPNQYIRIIRLQMAMEAIESGKYRTISEISHVAGFETPAYFNKLFKETYSRDVAELLG